MPLVPVLTAMELNGVSIDVQLLKKMSIDISEELADETDELDKPVIARIKKFSLRPMSEWEAIEQMELLGHNNFFVFYNAQTEAINVLYKRHDETFGLIQPEIG